MYGPDYQVLSTGSLCWSQVESVTHGTDEFSDANKATLLQRQVLAKTPLGGKKGGYLRVCIFY